MTKFPFLLRLRLAVAILLSSEGLRRLIKDVEAEARVQGAVQFIDSNNRARRRAIARRRRSFAKPRRR